jgi:predicted TIM-barrel fold metal-dependent hydrolase
MHSPCLCRAALLVSILTSLAVATAAQEPTGAPLDGRDGRELLLDRFRPKSMLQVESHLTTRAKFPVVDVHMHPRIRLHHDPAQLDEYVRVMDAQNIAVSVSLDGGLGENLREHMAYLWPKYRERFVIFANVEWQGSGKAEDPASWDCQRPDFGRRTAQLLAQAKEAGASGLKVFKDLGLVYKNPDGSFIRVDDPRWDPIWQACGELGFPVLIHSGDPAAFFLPIDETNERWEELHRRPEWSFYAPDFPKREEILQAFLNIVERHPKTKFIGAHVANNAEDLKWVAAALDKYPNLYAETAARIAELGRQPYTARKFLIDYADRVLFGTDGPRTPGRLHAHWRFFETNDEYFPYSEAPFPPQGFWNIYGVGLPDDVLKQLYHENAAKLISGVSGKLQKN